MTEAHEDVPRDVLWNLTISIINLKPFELELFR
jgi:hypothetical protein